MLLVHNLTAEDMYYGNIPRSGNIYISTVQEYSKIIAPLSLYIPRSYHLENTCATW